MGHTRIGRLNRTKAWRDVIGAFCAGADYAQIAKLVLDAASQGLNLETISRDPAYQKAVELLVQMAVGAQNGNFVEHMRGFGVYLSDRPSSQELNCRLSEAIEDAAWSGNGIKSDLADHAKQALLNAVTTCVASERDTELPNMPQRYDVDIFNSFGKKANFPELNRVFVSTLLNRSMEYYLAKILPNIVGRTERVQSVHELHAAYKGLSEHCYETSIVLRDYSNDWLGKHQHKLKDMSPRVIRKHGHFMILKMMRALKHERD